VAVLKATIGSFGISAVVFDLDGTLANTVSLDTGNRIRRVPHDVLKIARTVNHSYDADELMFNDGRERIPGYLVARGYRIGIVTDSPIAYASTLVGLLQIDFERLLAGKANRECKTKTQKLELLIDYWKIENSEELLYVGDTEDDAKAAANVGCCFMPVSQINYLRDLEEFPAIVREPASFNSALIRNDLHEIDICQQCGRHNSIRGILDYFENRSNLNKTCYGCDYEFSLGLSRFDLLAQIFTKLQIEPGNENRKKLQYMFFEILTEEVRDCVLDFCPEEGRFQFPPWLLTKSEISESSRVHYYFLEGLKNLFPLSVSVPDCSYLVPYKSDYGEDLYKQLKDFKTKRDMKRPEVHHSLGWIIAAAMAANLMDLSYVGIPYLVPIPPRGFSEEFPGEFSFRLTSQITDHLADYDGDLFHPFLVRDGSGIAINYDLFHAFLYELDKYEWVDLDILLIDDQHTMGNSMRKAKTAIIQALPPDKKVSISSFTWSKSMVQDQIKSTGCLTEEYSHLYSRKCLCKSPNLRKSKMKASLDLLYGSHRKAETETNTDVRETKSDSQDPPKKLNSCPYCHFVFNWAFVKITERCPHCDESLTDDINLGNVEADLDAILKDRIGYVEDDDESVEPF